MSAGDAHPLRQLIALCVRPGACALPLDEAEWAALLPLALAHGVAPLLFANLRERVLPVHVRDQLRLVYLANSFRNQMLRDEQQRLLAAFAQLSISAWPLKGPHLAEKLFGDFAARQVADMDLLIHPADLVSCDGILKTLGYSRQAQGDIAQLRDAGELLYLKTAEESQAQSAQVPEARFTFAVDLQQRVLPYGKHDPLAGRIRALGMTPENLLLLLCVNQVAHRFARLKYLLDVAACLRKLPHNFDWDDFIAVARLLDLTPGIYWSLAWARAAADAPVPEFALESLRPGWFSRKLAARVLGDDPLALLDRSSALDGPAGAWAILACTRGVFPRARQFARLLFPPPATLRQEFFATPGRPILYLYLTRLVRKLPAAFRRHS